MANEKRLIYSHSVLGEAEKAIFMGFRAEERKQNFLDMISAMLDNCPTVDAVEVVHGRWVEDTATDMIACTECGHAWNTIDNCTETFNYCPNCGADMR